MLNGVAFVEEGDPPRCCLPVPAASTPTWKVTPSLWSNGVSVTTRLIGNREF
jgi:hypothetical protein